MRGSIHLFITFDLFFNFLMHIFPSLIFVGVSSCPWAPEATHHIRTLRLEETELQADGNLRGSLLVRTPIAYFCGGLGLRNYGLQSTWH